MIRFSDLSGDKPPRSTGPEVAGSGESGRAVCPENENAVKDLYRQARDLIAASFDELSKGQRFDLSRIEGLAVALGEELEADDRAGLRLVAEDYDPHDYLAPHSANVFLLAVRLAGALGVEPEVLGQVGAGSLLHDVGMLWVPQEVWDKPGRLSPSEVGVMQMHPERGREAVVEVVQASHASRPTELLETIVLQEHEQPDGGGYPNGLREINTFANLVRVVDFLEAYTHARAYRPQGLALTDALRVLTESAGRQFDSAMVKLVLHELTVYPVGTRVELSTGEVAEVVAVNRGHLLKPVVLVVEDAQGHRLTEPRLVDLAERPGLYIRGVPAGEPAPAPRTG